MLKTNLCESAVLGVREIMITCCPRQLHGVLPQRKDLHGSGTGHIGPQDLGSSGLSDFYLNATEFAAGEYGGGMGFYDSPVAKKSPYLPKGPSTQPS